jgi:hypothetical protein
MAPLMAGWRAEKVPPKPQHSASRAKLTSSTPGNARSRASAGQVGAHFAPARTRGVQRHLHRRAHRGVRQAPAPCRWDAAGRAPQPQHGDGEFTELHHLAADVAGPWLQAHRVVGKQTRPVVHQHAGARPRRDHHDRPGLRNRDPAALRPPGGPRRCSRWCRPAGRSSFVPAESPPRCRRRGSARCCPCPRRAPWRPPRRWKRSRPASGGSGWAGPGVGHGLGARGVGGLGSGGMPLWWRQHRVCATVVRPICLLAHASNTRLNAKLPDQLALKLERAILSQQAPAGRASLPPERVTWAQHAGACPVPCCAKPWACHGRTWPGGAPPWRRHLS